MAKTSMKDEHDLPVPHDPEERLPCRKAPISLLEPPSFCEHFRLRPGPDPRDGYPPSRMTHLLIDPVGGEFGRAGGGRVAFRFGEHMEVDERGASLLQRRGGDPTREMDD